MPNLTWNFRGFNLGVLGKTRLRFARLRKLIMLCVAVVALDAFWSSCTLGKSSAMVKRTVSKDKPCCHEVTYRGAIENSRENEGEMSVTHSCVGTNPFLPMPACASCSRLELKLIESPRCGCFPLAFSDSCGPRSNSGIESSALGGVTTPSAGKGGKVGSWGLEIEMEPLRDA